LGFNGCSDQAFGLRGVLFWSKSTGCQNVESLAQPLIVRVRINIVSAFFIKLRIVRTLYQDHIRECKSNRNDYIIVQTCNKNPPDGRAWCRTLLICLFTLTGYCVIVREIVNHSMTAQSMKQPSKMTGICPDRVKTQE